MAKSSISKQPQATHRLKLILFAFLYFCEGAPIGLVWWALPTELTSRGVPIDTITLITASLALPWSLKFIWGPVIDRWRLSFLNFPRWVALFQVGMAVSLLPIAMSHSADKELIWACLLLHAVMASAQDVATDAWAIQISEESERGILNGMMQTGMILGRWLFGAGLLLASTIISFERATVLLSVFLGCSAVFLMLHPSPQKWGAIDFKSKSREPFWRSLLGRNIVFAFLCALTAGLGYEAIGAVVGPFLQTVGFDKVAVGWFYTLSLFCMGIGSLLGGRWADRIGHHRVYSYSIITIFTTALTYWLITMFQSEIAHWAFGMGLVIYVLIGVMIASSYALFMDVSDGAKDKATSFSLIMSGTNACESGAAFGVGRLIPAFGYPVAFVVTGTASLVSLFFLKRITK